MCKLLKMFTLISISIVYCEYLKFAIHIIHIFNMCKIKSQALFYHNDISANVNFL